MRSLSMPASSAAPSQGKPEMWADSLPSSTVLSNSESADGGAASSNRCSEAPFLKVLTKMAPCLFPRIRCRAETGVETLPVALDKGYPGA